MEFSWQGETQGGLETVNMHSGDAAVL
jgi:hypothetical protein